MSRSKRVARARKQAELEAKRRRERINRTWRGVAIGIGIGVVGVLAFFAFGGTGQSFTGDTTAQAWDLPELDGGNRIALADFEGKPTVAVFFASWCEVCEAEIPGFALLSDQTRDDINWVGINSQDNGRGMGDARKWGIDTRWPLARDIGGTTGNELSTATFGMRGMPLTVVYDGNGEVEHVQRGGISAEGLLEILEAAFGITT